VSAVLHAILRPEQPEPSRAAWAAWDAAQKRRLGWWSAWKRGGTDEIGNPVLFQWNWQHRMYASWRIYPTPADKGFLRHIGITRQHGCLTVAWWLSGCIIARSVPGACDIPATCYEQKAPAIHAAHGEYAGGGRDGATAREWPDNPPVTRKPQSYRDFLRGFFS